MSNCKNENKNSNNIKKSLKKHAEQTTNSNLSNWTPLCACSQGSMTIEAAVVIPLVAGFMAMLLFFFRILQVQTQVYSALVYAGGKTAAITIASSELEELVVAEAYLKKELMNYPLVERYVEGGALGVSLVGSDFSGEYVDLKASYYMKYPVGFFGKRGIAMGQRSKQHKWVGESSIDDEGEPHVYITKEGTVYHRSLACHYLDLSIEATTLSQVSDRRNKNGNRYLPCEACAKKGQTLVYITDYGEAYHERRDCIGLKRTIYEVKLSEVGRRKPCSKCA